MTQLGTREVRRRVDTAGVGPYRTQNWHTTTRKESSPMPETNDPEAQVRLLADLVGIAIDDADLPEVANRFASLMQELDRLRDLDLEGIEPVSIFPDAGE